MRKRRASSRVLGKRVPAFSSPLAVAKTICVTSCSRKGTSLACESQKRMAHYKFESGTVHNSRALRSISFVVQTELLFERTGEKRQAKTADCVSSFSLTGECNALILLRTFRTRTQITF